MDGNGLRVALPIALQQPLSVEKKAKRPRGQEAKSVTIEFYFSRGMKYTKFVQHEIRVNCAT